jgi:hypothetical protein
MSAVISTNNELNEAESFLSNARLLWNKLHYCLLKSPPLDSILGQFNPVYTLALSLFDVCFILHLLFISMG